ncbi:MaoC/PaaZ C-terminal domain-containing protein [Thermogemmatispora carboxidivorans]|uniref:MaoC/PaaZ C-terminal domain-containing protein n=1 Tax=Thermogemmatispora carboxidivorans TaxID=1382306 RepID=UPI00069BD40F|nr:MaoC/PaaZ C-terminal domain-containing protein [Thermogemmatispora carboxidivorans]
MTSSIVEAAIGTELPPLVKPPVTREQLRRYAEASGDYNPIHLDDEAARRVGLDGVIAHGMLSMAFLGQFIEQQIASYPEAFLARLKVRFASMVRPGDVLTCRGRVTARSREADGRELITIECWAENQRGERVTGGEALISLPSA